MAQEKHLNGRTLNAVIDFDLIVNTELGLIRFIRENYQDAKAFNLETLNKSDKEILSLLFSRKNENPLSIISTEENLGDIDKLYDSFFENYKQDIIDHSNSDSTIFKFVNYVVHSSSNFGVNAFIATTDDIESKSITSHFGIKARTIQKLDAGNITTKDMYYIKDYRFFTKINLEDKIAGKKIYMSPRQYNIDYFENVVNSLTSRNVFILFGKDYSHKGEIKDEQ